MELSDRCSEIITEQHQLSGPGVRKGRVGTNTERCNTLVRRRTELLLGHVETHVIF